MVTGHNYNLRKVGNANVKRKKVFFYHLHDSKAAIFWANDVRNDNWINRKKMFAHEHWKLEVLIQHVKAALTGFIGVVMIRL